MGGLSRLTRPGVPDLLVVSQLCAVVNSHRQSRVEDFERRAASAPASVYRHRSGGWPYIPVHDFADETETTVRRADCWCLLGGDAVLLECVVSDTSEFQPGLYARMDGDAPCWPKLLAVLPSPLTRDAVEKAMQRFVECGFPDSLISQLRPGDPHIRVSEGQ